MTWYALTLRYTDAKWPYASPNHRRGIAEALTDATDVLLVRESALPLEDRRAALRWSYSVRLPDRMDEPPPELARAVHWLASNTYRIDAFTHRSTAGGLARVVLSRISQTKDGRAAAPNTANRKRMVLYNIFEFACEIGALDENPLKLVRWTRPRTLSTVDPRTVINPQQARRFLTAVEAHSERGRRLKAFFACMYYAALTPEEVLSCVGPIPPTCQRSRVTGARSVSRALPPDRVAGGQRVRSHASTDRSSTGPRGDTRRVPVHPDLVVLLREHLSEYVLDAPETLLFVGIHGGELIDCTYLRVFHEARAWAFPPRKPPRRLWKFHSLRHPAVSTWLRTTSDAAQVAEWAGHSVVSDHPLLRSRSRIIT